ncbi:hypothetical protein FD754_018354 [Muntiacus muntjak]|uniref:Palmitoyltransferase n=1 Tax=Muntiacus muntjak TaxID=9888 RepID=A0A5N3UXC3_MUNMU|nr:hypothetical protein FD754_018354 [Muntiacus muntjak]
MDSLVLFSLCLALVLVGFVMIYLISRGAQIFSYIIPEYLQRAMLRVLHYLFHTGSYISVILHLILQGMVYTKYTWEIFGLCQELEFSLYYIFLPYLLLSVNLLFVCLFFSFFALSCVTNPAYAFDVMFPKNVRCPTLKNCTGAWNTQYFLSYLLTLTVSAATMAVVSTVFLVQLAVMSDWYLETYVDDLGHLQAVDPIVLIHAELPPGGYLCFCLYLAATNQTANKQLHCRHMARPPSAEPRAHQNVHSHGHWRNLLEIVLPATAHYERKKK